MGALNKRRRASLGATVMVLACLSAAAQAQDLLVRNATVHTASARGSLQHADVLVQGGHRPRRRWPRPVRTARCRLRG